MNKLAFRILCLAALTVLYDVSSAYSQDTETKVKSVKLTIEQVFSTVNQLILSGQLEAAEEILTQLEHAKANPVQIKFLRGMIYGAEGKWQLAEAQYRSILADKPELLRVRLELARALYEQKDGDNAKRQFELVLASKELPAEVIVNIRKFLATIYTQKKWSLNISLSAAPDTNINTATGSDRITLFGLPFELSDDAKKSSGVGITADMRAGYRFDIGRGKAIDIGASIRHTEYLHTKIFDQTFIHVQAGPRFYSRRNEIRIAATAGYARFGGRDLYTSLGGQITLQRQMSDRFKLSTILSGEKMSYTTFDSRDGEVYSIIGQGDYALSQVSALRGYIGYSRELTFDDSFQNKAYRLGAGYVRELSMGITANVRVNYTHKPYDGISFLYGIKRKDNSYGAGVSFIKRDFTILGFAPVVSYDYFRSRSNIDFFTYDRHKVNLGFTHIF